MTILKNLRPALVMLVLFTIITGVIYPYAITGIAQGLFPVQANGSLITRNGAVIGSNLIGQDFSSERYFHGRLSATSAPDPKDTSKTVSAPYNAANTAGSNLGPTSRALVERVTQDAEKLKAENPAEPVPTDLVTTSASGVDPDISPEAALFQIPRVAKARNMPQGQVRELVNAHIEGRTFGIFGEPHVNVLALNLALDQAKPGN